MLINNNYSYKYIDDNLVVTQKNDSEKVFVLNSLGTAIFNYVKDGLDFNQIVEKILEGNDVTKEVLIVDIEQFLNALKKRGIIIDN